ncbi:glycerate kinase type-2 family protein [Pseudonocardia endophytica]|uniref:Glycerate 2-kinase n=1 Tax=Pseudonocardia endophytica TaxID=401976 RepID=A0A4R1HNQ9_PSEEN|nr:glycerate kinase [Pseudonocardia endophytica]TCK21329.1 glycerate 2-kinase [Pseudonocardia endophytica]
MTAVRATGVGAPEALLRSMFDAAVTAADPAVRIPEVLGPSDWAGERTIVIGAGKAAATMARAVEAAWSAAPAPRSSLVGAVVTRYGHRVDCERIEVHEAGHPVPDGAGERATRRILELARSAGPADRVLALVSGGGSALLVAPLPGLTLAHEQEIGAALLRSGAPIDEINLVRRHLSLVKDGGLAMACAPAPVRALVVSDVPGDDPAVIASGPLLADGSTRADAAAVLDRRGIPVPDEVRRVLAGAAPDGPPPHVPHEIIAAPQQSLEAAASVARAAGVTPVLLGDAIEGESREVGRVLAGIAAQVRRHGQPAGAPCVLLSGGETTVTVRGEGSGGPNVELLLALATAARGNPVHAIACDTDGVDGAAEVAGAVVTPDTLDRAERLGLDPEAALAANDGHAFFAALGDQVVTGPTLTNVNDFRAVLVT